MKKLDRLKIAPTIIISLLCLLPNLTLSKEIKSSLDFALQGKKLLNVVYCSIYSASLEKPKQATRLIELGIDLGREFINAARNGKISEEDWRNNVPIIIGRSIWGPTTDFALGALWQISSEEVQRNMRKELSKNDCETCQFDKELQSNYQFEEYQKRNCELIK